MAVRIVDIRDRSRWLWVLLAVAVLAVASLVISAFVDDAALRAQIEGRASAALGMDVEIEGPVGLRLLPTPGVTAKSLQFVHGDSRVAQIERVRLQLAVAPLFVGRVELRRLVLDGADIRIVRDASGDFNVSFPGQAQAQLDLPPSVSFSGAISYLDEASGRRIELSDVAADGRVREGGLTLDPVELMVFGGPGRGRLDADFSADIPIWTLEFKVDGFELEEALQALEPEARAEGKLTFSTELSASGAAWEDVVGSLKGSLSLHGTALTLHGTDLDARLSDYDSTRRFGLLDVGAVLLAGPVGLVATKGRDFARLLSGANGQTEFREVNSTWTIRQGVAQADDVAAATKDNRLAARGKLDFSAGRFEDLTIMLLDKHGCAVLEQAVTGPFENPEVEEPGAIATLVGPLTELLQRGIDQFTDEECEVVYEGAVQHP
ncbi:MAG: AsmA family protein [Gammaproteobacteria bacterium]|nr:AsmA family protein [Gammaproteobacteria bacterium]